MTQFNIKNKIRRKFNKFSHTLNTPVTTMIAIVRFGRSRAVIPSLVNVIGSVFMKYDSFSTTKVASDVYNYEVMKEIPTYEKRLISTFY